MAKCVFGRHVDAVDQWMYVQAIAGLLAALIFLFSGTTPSHAVSQGCAAVRSGTLNTTVGLGATLNNPNVFTGTFEAGDTIEWAIEGEPTTLQISVGGTNIPVAGIPPNFTASFSFAASGTFTIGYNIVSSAGRVTIVTAQCRETRSERRAAATVMLNMQLDADLHQQRQLQNDLRTMAERQKLIQQRDRLERNREAAAVNLEQLRRQFDGVNGVLKRLQDRVFALEVARITAIRTLRALSVVSPKKLRAKLEAQIQNISIQFEIVRQAILSSKLRSSSLEAQIVDAENAIAAMDARIAEYDALLAGDSGGSGVNFQMSAAPMLFSSSASSPFDAAPRGGAGQSTMSFMADLNSLRAGARRKTALGQAPGVSGPLPGTADVSDPGYNFWVRGSAVGFDADQNGADRNGDAFDFSTGAYVQATDRLLLGGYYRFRDAESESPAQSSTLDTKGHGIGVHGDIALTTRLSAELHALYEFSDNDISTLEGTGDFDADQFTVHGRLQGAWSRGFWSFEPGVQVTYAHIDHDGYVNSAGAETPGDTIERGQLLAGPRVTYRRPVNGPSVKTVTPNFALNGIWNFIEADDTTLTNGTLIQGDEFALHASGGLSLEMQNGSQFALSGGYSGLGDSEQDTYSVSAQFRIPLGRP